MGSISGSMQINGNEEESIISSLYHFPEIISMLSDRQLSKLSFAMAVVGVVALFIIAYYTEPPLVPVSFISDATVGRFIKLQGLVSNISVSSDTLFFTLSDSTGSVRVVSFKNKNPLEPNNIVSVLGKISLYKNEYEIVAEEIKIV